jgi:hypothetical protein
VNLDQVCYGTFAEIGAAQEVARSFFRAGGAAGTVAKAMSAYDMKFSDAIYGAADRYVSRGRLETMLDREYALLLERLDAHRGERTRFFVFADTVATRSFSRESDGHGWLGVRFQAEPRGTASQVLIHARLAGGGAEQQQEALGVVGVNLVHAALCSHADPMRVVGGLVDDVMLDGVEVDMIEFSGPAFDAVDNRLMSLELVRCGLTGAAMFGPDGGVLLPSDVLYKRSVLIERGSFRPATNVTLDMLRCARAQFVQDPAAGEDPPLEVFEMTLRNLGDVEGIDPQDFLERADILATLGRPVLVSSYGEHHRLAAFLFRHTQKLVGLVMGVPTLRDLLDERYYSDLDGGILESFGRLFKHDLKVYAYPQLDARTGALVTAGNLRVAPHLRHLYAYLFENQCIEGLRDIDERCLPVYSRDVLARLRAGDPAWRDMVPPAIARIVTERTLLGYRPSVDRTVDAHDAVPAGA